MFWSLCFIGVEDAFIYLLDKASLYLEKPQALSVSCPLTQDLVEWITEYHTTYTICSMSGCKAACLAWCWATLAHPRGLYCHCFPLPSAPLTSASTRKHATFGSGMPPPLLVALQMIRRSTETWLRTLRMVWKTPTAQHCDNHGNCGGPLMQKNPPQPCCNIREGVEVGHLQVPKGAYEQQTRLVGQLRCPLQERREQAVLFEEAQVL